MIKFNRKIILILVVLIILCVIFYILHFSNMVWILISVAWGLFIVSIPAQLIYALRNESTREEAKRIFKNKPMFWIYLIMLFLIFVTLMLFPAAILGMLVKEELWLPFTIVISMIIYLFVYVIGYLIYSKKEK